jgi:L-alanine-DL-glutamate epimerase-like enolase superfamily enzyme
LHRNVALIKAVREAVGNGVDIMVDCLLANPWVNSLLYVIDLARRLEEFQPTWLEEPLGFDDRDVHVRLGRTTRIPLAVGEHFFTRWRFHQILESGAATALQPDPDTAGGVTEMRKIIALASTYGVSVIPTRTSRIETRFTGFSRAPSAPARWPSGALRSTVTSSISIGISTRREMATSIRRPVLDSATS